MSSELTDEDLQRMRADAEDYRDFMPPMASFMDPSPEFYTWELGGYVLRLLEKIEHLRDVNEELREAYRSCDDKFGSLPTGWQDDIDYRPDLIADDELDQRDG